MLDLSINGIIKSGVLTSLDSLTKYPSILTYHNLGSKGGMVDSLVEDKKFEGTVEITEKVDGTNFRVILWGDDYLIGKRDSLVYAKGDRIITEPCVYTVLDKCKKLMEKDFTYLTVVYGEVYGDNINRGSKQYCSDEKKRNFRVFDVARYSLKQIENILYYDITKIVSFRDHGGVPFLNTHDLMNFCEAFDLERTPIWGTYDASDIPTQVEDTLNWMEENFTQSRSILGEKPENANQLFGRAEGVVIRTPDRSMIRKLRFEDYRKGKLKGWV